MEKNGSNWRRPKAWLKWVAGGVLLIILLYVAFAPDPVDVSVVEVDRGPLETTVSAEGRTRIRDIFTISAPVNGRVLRVTLDPGDPVRAGETVVAIFEPVKPDFLDERTLAQARARLEQAKATAIRTKAEFDLAQTELTRARKLFEGGHVSRHALDQAQSNFNARRADHDASVAERTAAQAALIVPDDESTSGTGAGCCLRMASPVDGEVLRVLQESERVMTAGSPILEVGDPHDLEVVVDLLSQDAVRVSAGQPVRIDNWGGDQPLTGVVRRVEPSGFTKISALGVEEQRVNVIIDITAPAGTWTGLRDAYRVEPRIVVWATDDTLRVPIGALFRRNKGWAVFRLDGNDAVLTEVQVGERNSSTAQVVSGLNAGDRVVEHPSEDVEDGVSVRVR